MSKDYFYFNRTDRIVAIILLAVIIATAVIRGPGRNDVTPDPVSIVTDTLKTVDETPKAKPVYTRQNRKDSTRREYRRSDTARFTARYRESTYRNDVDTAKKDSVRSNRYPVKQRPSSPLDLNAIDSIMLIGLPGIGPVYASRILRYRNQLGGFAAVEQLTEINGLPDSLMEWFIVTDTVPLQRIRINDESLNELRRHPYINFYQARSIVEFRHDRGRIKGPGQLTLLEDFTARDLERLLPYLDFGVNQ
jgi:DNA uptake protein ComE-like DNA-binding protein